MIPYRSTPVPNIIFDHYLRILKPTEVTLLLVVIRQTIGWYDYRTGRRKHKDWLSGSQLRLKTGYSRKAISIALDSLVKQDLIKVFDGGGRELNTPEERRGKTHLYYAFHTPTCVKSTQDLSKIYASGKKMLVNKYSLLSLNKHQP